MPVIRSPSSAVHEEHHDVETSLEGGDVRRRPAVPIRLPDAGARVDEQLDHLGVAHETGVSEERLTVGVEAVDARLDTRDGRRGESLQQRVQESQIALRNGLMEERVTDLGLRGRRRCCCCCRRYCLGHWRRERVSVVTSLMIESRRRWRRVIRGRCCRGVVRFRMLLKRPVEDGSGTSRLEASTFLDDPRGKRRKLLLLLQQLLLRLVLLIAVIHVVIDHVKLSLVDVRRRDFEIRGFMSERMRSGFRHFLSW